MIKGTFDEIAAIDAATRIEAEGLHINGSDVPDLNLNQLKECLTQGWEPIYGVFRRKGGPVVGAPGIQFTIRNKDALSLIPVSLGPETVKFLRGHPTVRIEFEDIKAKAA